MAELSTSATGHGLRWINGPRQPIPRPARTSAPPRTPAPTSGGSAGAARPRVRATVAHVLDDHRAFDAPWQVLGPALAAVRDGAPGDWPRIGVLAEAFITRHADHPRLEDGLLFPAASADLDDAALAAIGQEMARRRQPA